ncbi:hypothetical protein [Streptosporangium vulgare]|uniref:hypothetical protein n=1 Tax=Streptosporangium vulgare TaxID=46190 RepID=UPI0031D3EF18
MPPRTARSYFSLMRAAPEQPEPGEELVDFCIPWQPVLPRRPRSFGILENNLSTILKFYPSDADTITAELCGVLGLNPADRRDGQRVDGADHLDRPPAGQGEPGRPDPHVRALDRPADGDRQGAWTCIRCRRNQGFALDVDAYVNFVRHRGSRVAVICNPNNPDGGYLRRHEVIALLDRLVDLGPGRGGRVVHRTSSTPSRIRASRTRPPSGPTWWC